MATSGEVIDIDLSRVMQWAGVVAETRLLLSDHSIITCYTLATNHRSTVSRSQEKPGYVVQELKKPEVDLFGT